MIQVVGLQKFFGGRELFSDLSFNLSKGEKIGLVGRNGTGKSTLFKILMDREGYDGGTIVMPKNYRIGYLEQHLHFTYPTIVEEVMSIFPPEERYLTYMAEDILMGLGFSYNDLSRAPQSFSGGFQIRLNLAKLLLMEPDLLLLDEPTNYLDIVSQRYVVSFLKRYKNEIILISHDRAFMDEVVNHTMGIVRTKIKKVKGQTSDFYEQVLLEEETYEKTRLNEDKKRQELQKFVDRFKAKASKATQAQSKMKQIDKMGQKDALKKESTLEFAFSYNHVEAKTLFEAKNLSFNYPGGPTLINNLSFALKRGDCLGIIGKNGRGKSTLLNLIAENIELANREDVFRFHQNAQLGFFGQTNIDRLSDKNTVEDEITLANPNLARANIRSICGTIMFTGDDALKKVKVLSGGEKARVMLGKILATPCNMLLLDEPTNHLDMESIDGLCEGIESFQGASMVVTHSEEVLRNVCNRIIAFMPTETIFFEGSYDEFLLKYETLFFSDEEDADPSSSLNVDKVNGEAKKAKVSFVESKEEQKEKRALERKREELEESIIAKEEELKIINAKILENPSLPVDEMSKLAKKISTLEKDINFLNKEWESL